MQDDNKADEQGLEKNDRNSEQIEIALINEMLIEKGPLFIEQKFFFIVQSIVSATKKDLSSIELYSKIFPDLVPTRKGISKVFENAFYTKEFKPLFHSSEYLYRQWLTNFSSCKLVNSINSAIAIDRQYCKETLDEFRSWVVEFPSLKGSFIKSSIKWDLGTLPLNVKTNYNPKNIAVKEDLLKQLKEKGTIQLVTFDDIRNKIEISIENSAIVLVRKKKYPITPHLMQLWLKKFGINVSISATTYLIEFGMPYNGQVVSLDEILRFTNNGTGIIGLLAFQLAFLIKMDESNCPIHLSAHPLLQSVVLALARLEFYLNPRIACL